MSGAGKTGEIIPIILNRRAGGATEGGGEEQLRRMAREAGFTPHLITSRSAEQMRAILCEMVQADAPKVAVAGGDGTIAAAVQELAHTKTALGILVQGTYNNFATAMRLPSNLPKALKTLQEGWPRAIDLGKVGGTYFTESAGVGLFADGLAALDEKNDKDVIRGLYTALRLLLSLRAGAMRVTVDGKTLHLRIALCEVANTYRMGPGLPIAPEAELEDGKLDVVILGALLRREVPEYLNAIRSQLHLNLPKVTVLQAKHEVRIETMRRRSVHCDGRIIGETPVTIRVQPGALNVLVDDRR